MTRQDDTRGGLNAAVAATLNGERNAAGLTHDELAARSGVNKWTLMRLLNSQRAINVDVLAQLAPVFNLTPAEVLAKAEDWRRRNSGGPDAVDVEETARQIVAEARGKVRDERSAAPDTVRPAKRRDSDSA